MAELDKAKIQSMIDAMIVGQENPDAAATQQRNVDELRNMAAEEAKRNQIREFANIGAEAAGGMIDRPAQRPTKKQRRQIHRFKNYSE